MNEETEIKDVEMEQTEENKAPVVDADEVENVEELDAGNSIDKQQDEEVTKLKEEIVRLHAEMDNIRKRNAREFDNLRKFALDKFAKSLIPVADSLDKALEVSQKDDCQVTAEQMIEGTQMTQKVFLKVLKDNGVEVINPVNEKFNPEFHEAMTQVPNPDLKPNTIVDVFQKGYILNGRLVRPAMVVVSK
ncbi:MAG TPA: nucleotide exchange factor GrpE [Oceanospirillales bacterium]|nr:nucleotide exchange factor GrpE [Oceanospirillales bacterium]